MITVNDFFAFLGDQYRKGNTEVQIGKFIKSEFVGDLNKLIRDCVLPDDLQPKDSADLKLCVYCGAPSSETVCDKCFNDRLSYR